MIIKPRANRLKKDLVGKICQMLSDDSFRNYFNYQMNLEEYAEGVRVRGEEGKGLKVGERCKGKGWGKEKGYGWEKGMG